MLSSSSSSSSSNSTCSLYMVMATITILLLLLLLNVLKLTRKRKSEGEREWEWVECASSQDSCKKRTKMHKKEIYFNRTTEQRERHQRDRIVTSSFPPAHKARLSRRASSRKGRKFFLRHIAAWSPHLLKSWLATSLHSSKLDVVCFGSFFASM